MAIKSQETIFCTTFKSESRSEFLLARDYFFHVYALCLYVSDYSDMCGHVYLVGLSL